LKADNYHYLEDKDYLEDNLEDKDRMTKAQSSP
jgi:hypothetical protein